MKRIACLTFFRELYENRLVSYLMSEIQNRHAKWMKCMEARKHTFEKWYERNEPKISCHSLWFWYVYSTCGFGNAVKWFEWKSLHAHAQAHEISQSSQPICNLDMNSRWRAKICAKSYHNENKKAKYKNRVLTGNEMPKLCSSSSAIRFQSHMYFRSIFSSSIRRRYSRRFNGKWKISILIGYCGSCRAIKVTMIATRIFVLTRVHCSILRNFSCAAIRGKNRIF